jgi:Cu+-exporting ATPase
MTTTSVTDHTLQFTISGMTCAACAGRIERVVGKVPGVRQVAVNLATEIARIDVEPTVTYELLQQAIENTGYGATPIKATTSLASRAQAQQHSQQEHEAKLRARLFWALVFSGPVFLLEMGSHAFDAVHHWVQGTLGDHRSWMLQWALTSAVILGPGRAFFVQGFKALRAFSPDMNSLVSIGTAAAYLYSSLATWAPAALNEADRFVYFEAAAVVVALVLLGKWLEAKAKSRTSRAITGLIELQPAEAWKINTQGMSVKVPIETIQVGDIVELRPGERVAVDGQVVEGSSSVDEAMLTGEPIPVTKEVGALLTAGSVNHTGSVRYRATAVGSDTALAGIIAAVERAQTGKLPVQDKVDAVTRIFVPVVLLIALMTFLAWWALGPEDQHGRALVYAVAVLVIACPCAMGLATPTSILVGSGRAASEGVLFRDAASLQRLGEVRVVAFDKTGTLTEGRPSLVQQWSFHAWDQREVLRLAASLEARSEHPLGQAIIQAAQQQQLALESVTDFSTVPAMGAQGKIGARAVRVGADRWFADVAQHANAEIDQMQGKGHTIVWAEIDGELAGAFALMDQPRAQAAAVIQALHAQGIRTAMITGDNAATAQAVATKLGIQRVDARVAPVDKARLVSQWQAPGAVTAFVGDGINDAPALAQADVGIAMGKGTGVAIETANVVLGGGRLEALVKGIACSRATLRNIHQNLLWAFAYNVLLIPVAAGVLVPFGGPALSPVLAAAAMGLSSLFVLGNALRLRKARWSFR